MDLLSGVSLKQTKLNTRSLQIEHVDDNAIGELAQGETVVLFFFQVFLLHKGIS